MFDWDLMVSSNFNVLDRHLLDKNAVRHPNARMLTTEITAALAAKLGCSVTTIGYHSGVKTTCTA